VVKLDVPEIMKKLAKMIVDTEIRPLTAINKLCQLSDGFNYEYEYCEEQTKNIRTGYTFIGSPKIEQLKLDLEEYADEGRIIVYSGYQASVEIVTKTALECKWAVIQVDGRGWKFFSEEFPNGTIDDKYKQLALNEMDRSTDKKIVEKLCFVGEVDSAGTGLELSASSIIVYYSNSNKGESRMQTEDRPYSNNMDKGRGLLIKDYVCFPVDELKLAKLKEKKELQSISMGDLKNIVG
jgi:hypothetical protein